MQGDTFDDCIHGPQISGRCSGVGFLSNVGWGAVEDDGLSLEVRAQAVNAAFAADAGLFESSKPDRHIAAPAVVTDRSGAQLAGDGVGSVRIVREDRIVECVNRAVGDVL